MKVSVVRNSKESTDRVIARFNKKVQSSRKLLRVKDERYHSKKPTKRYIRAAAVMRDFHRTKREKMKHF